MPRNNRHSYDVSTAHGQKRLMAESVGMLSEAELIRSFQPRPTSDYGCDPIGDGTFRMVPSGDIVDYAERMRRLPAPKIR